MSNLVYTMAISDYISGGVKETIETPWFMLRGFVSRLKILGVRTLAEIFKPKSLAKGVFKRAEGHIPLHPWVPVPVEKKRADYILQPALSCHFYSIFIWFYSPPALRKGFRPRPWKIFPSKVLPYAFPFLFLWNRPKKQRLLGAVRFYSFSLFIVSWSRSSSPSTLSLGYPIRKGW